MRLVTVTDLGIRRLVFVASLASLWKSVWCQEDARDQESKCEHRQTPLKPTWLGLTNQMHKDLHIRRREAI